MCGLFGVLSSTLSKAEIERAQFLGILSSTRGIDSTGVCILGNGNGKKIVHTIEKRVLNPVSFLSSKAYKDAMDSTKNPFLLMGHSRWATVGEINHANAHPLQYGSTILCHNGTIDEFREKNSPGVSDSAEFCLRIDRNGLLSACKASKGGAYAVTFVDLQKRTINFARNLMRPLCFMYTKANNTLYWASELWMLEALAAKEGEKNYRTPFLLKSDLHHVIQFNRVHGDNIDMDIPDEPVVPATSGGRLFPRKGKFSGVSYCKTCQKDSYYCGCEWENYKYDTSGTGVMRAKEILGLPAPKKDTSVPVSKSKVSHVYRGWEGSLVPISDVIPFLNLGCSGCKRSRNIAQKNYWFTDQLFVCDECYDHDGIVEEYIKKKHTCYESKLVRTN